MTSIFAPDSAHLIALDAVVRRAERVERRLRRLEAERLQILADAFDVAAAESEATRCHSSVPRGERAELAFRSVRAELAAALRLSEATIERELAHAYALTHHFPDVLHALREGLIGEQHTRVIVDAAAVIGEDDSFETASRRYSYESDVLGVAVEETPNRLRPIARRLAEQHAARSLDERHETARARRRVFLIDREDGMSDLIAQLPAVEAHAAYDRLTRLAIETERREHEAGPHDTRDARALEGPVRRGRDELRADLLAELLLSGSIPGDASQPGGSPAIRGRVQLIVSDETLFAYSAQQAKQAQHSHQAQQTQSRQTQPQQTQPHGAGDAGEAVPVRSAPAELAGFGPIDVRSARLIAAQAEHWGADPSSPGHGSGALRRALSARRGHATAPAGERSALPVPRLPGVAREMRSRSHGRCGAGRADGDRQSRPPLPGAPHPQASRRLASGAARGRRAGVEVAERKGAPERPPGRVRFVAAPASRASDGEHEPGF